MNAWAADLLSNSLAQRVAWALIHFLWQGAAVALLLAATLQLVRGRSAQVRWVLCCGALGLMAVLPVVTACVVSVDAPYPAAEPVGRPPGAFATVMSPPGETAPEPAPAAAGEEPASPTAGPARVPDGAAEAAPAAPQGLRLERFVRPILPWSFAAWLVGMVVMSVWHLGGWLLLERTKRHGVRFADGAIRDVFDRLLRRLRVSRPVRLLQSARVAVPTVAGWLRPVVLLPASALSGLSIEQIEAILAHELAHIRRYDCLVRLIQAVVETLLFYHPAVWWVSRRIRQESEHCCDDAAVAVCGSRVTYARALACMEDFRAAPAMAAAASGGRLLDRIRRIVGLRRDRAGGDIRRWGAAAAAVFVLAGLTVAVAIFYGCQAGTGTLESHKPADADDWGPPGTDGLRIRLVVPKLKGEAVPTLSAERYFDAPPGIRKPEVRLEIDNKGDRSIRLAKQNVTGGRRNIVDDWLIGLSLEMRDGDGVRRLTRTDDQDDFWSAIGSMPSARQIKPGETVGFGLRLNKLADERGRPLSSLHGPRRLRPVLEIRDGRFGLWHGTARGKFVPVVIQRKRDAAWGKPVEGVQSRLRRGVFRNGEQWLSFDLRNDSSNLSVKLSPGGVPREILVDNVPYRWSGRIAGGLPVCKPGQRVTGAEFKLDKNWTAIKSVSGPKTLELKPGKHTVQAIVYAGAKDAAHRGPIVRVLSNPVEIEILPAGKGPAKPPGAANHAVAAQLEQLWADLGALDADKADKAQTAMAALKGQAVAFLAARLTPPPADAARVKRLVAKFDAFAVREKASAELLKIGRAALPALRKTLAEPTLPPEARARVKQVVKHWTDPYAETAEARRIAGALHVLAWIGTTRSSGLLARLAPEGWFPGGKAVEGFQVRLRATKSRWNEGAVPRLWAHVRNQGKRNLFVITQSNRCELEVDGRWYRRPLATGEIRMRPQPFPPGRQYDNIAVNVDQWWELAASQNARRPRGTKPEKLKLTAGKHTIRVAFTATAAKNAPGKPVRGVSNPVVIEVISAKEIAARPKRLKSQKNAFELRLAYHGPKDNPGQSGVKDPFRSLIIHTTLVDIQPHWGWSAISISEDQAARIIDHLQAEGSLADALPFTDRPPPDLDGPAYSLTVKGPDNLVLYKPLGWGLTVLDFLERLRTVLEGDAAKALDRLMAVLGPQRKQWEAVAKWGQAVEGVQVRLRAKQSKWRQGLTPRLLADVRNLGTRKLLVYRAGNFWTSSELEIDGRWYRRRLPKHNYRPPLSNLVPGRQFDKILVDLGRGWYVADSPIRDVEGTGVTESEPGRLKLAPGKHTIRVAVTMPLSGNRPGDHVRAISNPVEIEIVPAKLRARYVPSPVWAVLLARSPIRSLEEYHHVIRTDPPPRPPLYKPLPVPECDLEIRRAKDQARVARIPYKAYCRQSGELSKPGRRRIGQLPDGKYLVALCIANGRCSNVAAFEIDSAYDSAKERPLRLEAIEGKPWQTLRYLGVRGTGPTPADPKFDTSNVHFPVLIVDGVTRALDGTIGVFQPLPPGRQFDSLLDVSRYGRPITLDKPRTIKASSGQYESNTVRISLRRPLGEAWDQATPRLPAVPPPSVALRGKVIGSDGKLAEGYEVSLSQMDGTCFREKLDAKGHYQFVNVPAGTYELACNPAGMGQPVLVIRDFLIEGGKTRVQDLGLQHKFIISGKVTDADGRPVSGVTVDITCEDSETRAEFSDTTKTDAQGRYRLGSPMGTVSYLGINGKRVHGPMPQLKLGENTAEHILKNIGGKHRAVPAAPAAEGAAFGPVTERVVAYRKGFPSERVPEPGPMYLDLDTGAYAKFKALPASKMVRGAGVDVYYEPRGDGTGMRLATSNLQLQPLSDKTGWDSSPKHVWRALMVASPSSLTYPGRSTLAFKTRDGGIGILRILGFTKDRRGIRIRYKVVQWPKAGRSATTRATVDRALKEVAARIPHLWVDGKKVKVDLTLRVVRTDSPKKIESNWFLRRPGRDEDEHIGTDLPAMSEVRQLIPSPDGKFLAVLSVGEGHPIVQVVDLPLLVKRKTYKVLHEIDPFPVGVTIDRWAQDSLLLRSDMLLTHRGEDGRFHPVLCMERTQTYSLSVTDGVIKALSADAKEPVAYFIGQLSSKDATERGSAIMALTFLKARAAIPALRKVLSAEKDESIREVAAEALKRIRASKATTRPATRPGAAVGTLGT